MALDANTAFVNTDGSAFPDTEAVNASGPTATDGTEFVKIMIDNYMFGPQQALLDYAGLIPSGLSEEAGASQELEAMQKSFGHPGEAALWFGNSDPAVVGLRLLLLHGQGVLVASYPELATAVYVGDGDNATAETFFRADDAAGTIRNTAGAYIILPEGRGRALRAIDDTGLIDPDGASRLPGDLQADDYLEHNHVQFMALTSATGGSSYPSQDYVGGNVPGGANTSGLSGGDETRMKNISAHLCIRY